MHEVLVNRLGGLSLPRKSVVRLTDRPDMTLDVYRGRKTTIQQQHIFFHFYNSERLCSTDISCQIRAKNSPGFLKKKLILVFLLFLVTAANLDI